VTYYLDIHVAYALISFFLTT